MTQRVRTQYTDVLGKRGHMNGKQDDVDGKHAVLGREFQKCPWPPSRGIVAPVR